MTMPSHPGKPSYSGTYFVQDQKNEEELRRLADQDHLVTASMGGVLPEQANPRAFQRVLDIACGTGGWALEVAQTYPEMSLVGIDINLRMIEYARASQRKAHRRSRRVSRHGRVARPRLS